MFQSRICTIEDLPQVAKVEASVFTDAWTMQGLTDTWNNPQAVIIGAFDEKGKLGGYVIFYYVIDEGEIARIATDPAFRRQKVASNLLTYMKEFSDSKGITRWLLDVRESNEVAIAFYEKWGFAVDGKRKNFYRNPQEDAILMSRMCE